MASLQYHEGACDPCALCEHMNTRYKHLSELKVCDRDSYKWLEENEANLSVHPVHAYPASNRWRNKTKPYFQPRWRPKVSKPPTKCQVHGCEQLVYSKTTLISLHELERILGRELDTEGTSTSSIGLCQEHYLAMYTQRGEMTQCHSCKTNAAPHTVNYLPNRSHFRQTSASHPFQSFVQPSLSTHQ